MRSPVIDYFSSQAAGFAARYTYDPGFQQRLQVWTELLDRYIPRRTTAYDIGCGSGILSFHMAHKGVAVRGFDAASGMIELCERTKLDLKVPNAAFTELLVSPESLSGLEDVDLVVCSSLLEYLPDLQEVMCSLARLLTPNGVLLASIPNSKSLYRRMEILSHRLTRLPKYYGHVRHVLNVSEIQQLASNSGLEIVEHSYFANRKAISRLARFVMPPQYVNDFVLVVFRADTSR